MRCSLKRISPPVSFTDRSNLLSPLRLPFKLSVAYLLKLERALRESISPSVVYVLNFRCSEFKLVVLIDDSDSVNCEQLLMTDLLKLHFLP